MRETRFLHFRSQWPWLLTFRPQICSPSYSCPAPCFHQIGIFYVFPISRKLETREGRTDGEGATLNAASRGAPHNIREKIKSLHREAGIGMWRCLWRWDGKGDDGDRERASVSGYSTHIHHWLNAATATDAAVTMALSSRNDGCDTRSLLWAEFMCGELVEWTRDTFRQLLSLSYCLFACVCGCVEEGGWTIDRSADQHNWTFRSLSHTPIAIHTHKPAASIVDRQLVLPYLPSHHTSRVFTPILCTCNAHCGEVIENTTMSLTAEIISNWHSTRNNVPTV